MKHRITALLLAVIMLLSLTACGAAPAVPAAPEVPEAPEAAPAEEVQAEPAAEESAENVISVSTVDELLAAIGSDRTISLAAGTYDLSTAADYGAKFTAGTDADYYWEQVFDGNRLVISNASNLTLRAEGEVILAAIPRYADVVYLLNCENVSLEGLTLGHTEEPGSCAGGVLYVDNCLNTAVTDCALYGCGITAINAVNSVGLTVSGGRMYDCSMNAMNANSCRNIRVENCEVYDCGSEYSSLFNVSGVTGFVLSDCNVHDNVGAALISNGYSFDVYLVGCDFSQGNSFYASLFDLPGGETYVGGCLFNGTSAWPDIIVPGSDNYPLDMNGEMLNSSAIFDMAQEHIDVAPAAPAAAVELEKTVNADGVTEVHVNTVDELLAAIAPNTTVYLNAEQYDLSTAANYGGYGGDYYYWQINFDGPGLVITGVDNLSLISENGTEILTTPRYVDVIAFSSCSSVMLDGLTVGHTEEPNSCMGGVLYFERVTDAIVNNCHLYGCGTIGVSTLSCDNIAVTDTEIYDCSSFGASINDSTNIKFENCDIHDCGNYAVALFNTQNFSFNGSVYNDGFYELDSSDSTQLAKAEI